MSTFILTIQMSEREHTILLVTRTCRGDVALQKFQKSSSLRMMLDISNEGRSRIDNRRDIPDLPLAPRETVDYKFCLFRLVLYASLLPRLVLPDGMYLRYANSTGRPSSLQPSCNRSLDLLCGNDIINPPRLDKALTSFVSFRISALSRAYGIRNAKDN